MRQNTTTGRLRLAVTALAGLVGALALALAGAPAATASTIDQPWTVTGPGTTTSTGADGSSTSPAMSYALSPAWGQQAWTFTTTATAAGTVDVSWTYSGNHSYFAVTAGLNALQTPAGGAPQSRTLVNAGPANCCSAPSNGFTYTGTTEFVVAAGDIYGFQMTGSNGDSSNFLTGTLSLSLSIAQTIDFPQPADVAGDAGPLTLAATASSGLPVEFSTTTPAVCTVSGSSLTLVAAGTCTVSADQPGDAAQSIGAAPSVVRSFEVSAIPQTLTFATPADTRVDRGPVALSATSSSGLAVTLASTTPSVCTVSGTTATLATAGTCTVVATQDGDDLYAAASPVSVSFAVLAAPAASTPAATPSTPATPSAPATPSTLAPSPTMSTVTPTATSTSSPAATPSATPIAVPSDASLAATGATSVPTAWLAAAIVITGMLLLLAARAARRRS